MSSGKFGKAESLSSAREVQELFEALVDELDRALEHSASDSMSDEDWDRLHRARAAALRGLALSRRLNN